MQKALGENTVRYSMDNTNNIEIKKYDLRRGTSWVLRSQNPAQKLPGGDDELVGMAPSAHVLHRQVT